MKRIFIYSFIMSGFLIASCKNEVCKHCVRCISYDNNFIIQNEVKHCESDTSILNNYKEGFISGAASVGRSAICFDLGIECECL